MTQQKKFKYIGLNGTIFSPVLIPKADKIEFIELKADEGKILTNGISYKEVVLVLPEDVSKWSEIDNQNLGQN